jgi:hypothetical protein
MADQHQKNEQAVKQMKKLAQKALKAQQAVAKARAQAAGKKK